MSSISLTAYGSNTFFNLGNLVPAVADSPIVSPKTVPVKNCFSFASPKLLSSPSSGLSGADKYSTIGFTNLLVSTGFSIFSRKLNKFSS